MHHQWPMVTDSSHTCLMVILYRLLHMPVMYVVFPCVNLVFWMSMMSIAGVVFRVISSPWSDFGGHKTFLLYHIYVKIWHTTYTNVYILYINNWFMLVYIGVVIITVFEVKYVTKYVDFILKSTFYTCIMTYIDNGWFYKPNTCCILFKRFSKWYFRIPNHFLWNWIVFDREFFLHMYQGMYQEVSNG